MTPLNMTQACREAGLHYNTFLYYLKSRPEIDAQFKALKEQRVQYRQELSENIIEKALKWKMKKLSDKDIVDTAKWALEKTDKRYNPKQVIEQTVEEINKERSSDDILSDIADLIT